MYKIIGSDGKEYGPVSLDRMRQWVGEGRINARTRIQAAGAQDWKPAAEVPEVNALLAERATTLEPAAGGGSAAPAGSGLPQKGLAVASLVLGILSLLTCIVTGLPAIICGHIARGRAREDPARYGGQGMALAGLILGYLSIVMLPLVILPAMLLPALSQAKARAQSITCINHMKQIGLAVRTWAIDNGDQFPFNVSTNMGGTLELSSMGSDGFDRNPVIQFQVLSNELGSPAILICPGDTKKHAALDFMRLQPDNVSYQVCSGTNLDESNPQAVLIVCPIHRHKLLCDGSVQPGRKRRR